MKDNLRVSDTFEISETLNLEGTCYLDFRENAAVQCHHSECTMLEGAAELDIVLPRVVK